MKKLFILLLFFTISLQASLSEEKLKIMLIGKVAKYIVWDKTHLANNLTIAILEDSFDDEPTTLYSNKNIKVNYITDISQLKKCDILYITNSQASKLSNILNFIKGKSIFTISDIRGFVQKGGMLQLYFVAQKIKLKINLKNVKKEHLNIRSTLLRIAKVIKD